MLMDAEVLEKVKFHQLDSTDASLKSALRPNSLFLARAERSGCRTPCRPGAGGFGEDVEVLLSCFLSVFASQVEKC